MILVFPEESRKNKTIRVLKLPKMESSIRKVFLPKSVAEILVEWKKDQDKIKETLGDEVQKTKKEHLFANRIHGIIKSVDKINIQKRTDYMEKTDHNAHSVYWRKSRMG